MYEDSPIPGMHPRQARVLIEVPEAARATVQSRAHLLQNLQGGLYSQCLAQAAAELARYDGDTDALEALSRRDNHAALAACGRNGCTACARDAARL